MNKKVVTSAVVAAMGLGAAATAQAANVTGFTIQDVGSSSMGTGGYLAALDGRSGGFGFSSKMCNAKTYTNCASTFFGNVASGTIFGSNVANATGSFSTGFSFGPPFVPFLNTQASGDVNFRADITASTLTISDLGFGGQFAGAFNFDLAPDTNFPLEVLWAVPHGTTTDEFDVAIRWGHIITTAEDGTGQFTGQSAQWILEGCMTTNTTTGGKCTSGSIPVPAAAWLFGSGLVGLAGVARRRKARKS